MEKINYPLLVYTLDTGLVLGLLVGTEYELVEKDVKALKTSLSNHLQRIYKRHNEYPYIDLLEPKLKMVNVAIQPSYIDKMGAFPVAHQVELSTPAVFGETERGHYACFFPLFNKHFIYYDARQFDILASHFLTSLSNAMEPEKIYRQLTFPKPKLDQITLKVNKDREPVWNHFPGQRSFPTLSHLAEQYPLKVSKASGKKSGFIPDAAWEMEAEISEIIDKLINNRVNVLVVGPRGVGKSALISTAVRRLSAHSRRQKLDFTFWRIMSQRITASARYLGEWQETCEKLIMELMSANGILWVMDIIQLIQTGGEGAEDSVGAFLIPFLQGGKLQIVGETTEEELETIRRLLPGFVQNFQLIRLAEMPENKVFSILDKLADFAAQKFKIQITPDARMLAHRLLLRYYPYEAFPGKAIRFFGFCLNEAENRALSRIDKNAVIRNFIQQTGLPELFLRDEILLESEALRSFFSTRIIGQNDVVDKLCEVVKVFKAGINNPAKPIATLIFAGPTGVGKTASAKVLAEYFFGAGQNKSPLIRLDMSEFQHPAMITRLIGEGKEPGQLVKEIRERPFAVLLLDEVEKAHPAIFDALLTVLDEGHLVDGFGRITNFRNAVIILTSNLGASRQQSIAFTKTTSEEKHYMSAIEGFFRPEFFNRIDGVVLFNPLQQADIQRIAFKELRELDTREGIAKRRLTLAFSPGLVDWLVNTGFDERYGARPLQRAIDRYVVTPLAAWMLEHQQVTDCRLSLDWSGGLLVNIEQFPE